MDSRQREPGPYVFESDEDGHFYVIPKARIKDWCAWLSSEDAKNGVEPDWADAIGGAPSLVSFPKYSRE
jgi:squalene cyclase